MPQNTYEVSFLDTVKEYFSGIAKALAALSLFILAFQMFGLAFESKTSSVDSNTWVPSYSVKVGPEDAKVKFIYFVDLQCPACKANDPELKKVQEKYKDRVQFVYRNLPIESAHPYAKIAGRAAMALAKQDQAKYFEFKDQIFVRQAELSPGVIDEIGKELAPDFALWNQDRKSRVTEDEVLGDKDFIDNQTLPTNEKNGDQTKVSGTPGNVILKNGEVVDWWTGGKSAEEQGAILDSQLL